MSQLALAVLVDACGPSTVINSASPYSQKCPVWLIHHMSVLSQDWNQEPRSPLTAPPVPPYGSLHICFSLSLTSVFVCLSLLWFPLFWFLREGVLYWKHGGKSSQKEVAGLADMLRGPYSWSRSGPEMGKEKDSGEGELGPWFPAVILKFSPPWKS